MIPPGFVLAPPEPLVSPPQSRESEPLPVPPKLSYEDIDTEALLKIQDDFHASQPRAYTALDFKNDPFYNFVVHVSGNVERGSAEKFYLTGVSQEKIKSVLSKASSLDPTGLLKKPQTEHARMLNFIHEDVEFDTVVSLLPDEKRKLIRDTLSSATHQSAVVEYFLKHADDDAFKKIAAKLGTDFEPPETRNGPEFEAYLKKTRVALEKREVNMIKLLGVNPLQPNDMEVEGVDRTATSTSKEVGVAFSWLTDDSLQKAWSDAAVRYMVQRVSRPEIEDMDFSNVTWDDYCLLLESRLVASTQTAYNFIKSCKSNCQSLTNMIKNSNDTRQFSLFTKLVAHTIIMATNPSSTTGYTDQRQLSALRTYNMAVMDVRVWAGFVPEPPKRRRTHSFYG